MRYYGNGPTEYWYNWHNNPKRRTLRGRHCYVIANGRQNSVLVEFIDNKQREVVSRRALRKVLK